MINSLGSRPNFGANTLTKSADVKKEQAVQNMQSKQSDKVSQITAAIADGSYKVDISKTAKAIADTIA